MLLLLVLTSAIILYIAWSIGSNDAANSIGITAGPKSLGWKELVAIGSLFGFSGAIFLGQGVTSTIANDIIPSLSYTLQGSIIIALVSAIIITISSFRELPISTTQVVVGSVIGYGLAVASTINWPTVSWVVLSWIFSPFVGMAFGFMVYYILKEKLFMKVKGMMQREKFESLFIAAQLFSISLLALAYGSNDLANAIGIFSTLPSFGLKMMGAAGLAIGMLTYGFFIFGTKARKIIAITPARGFVSQIGAATVTLFFTAFGMPVSTTFITVGNILGTGLAAGASRVNWRILVELLSSWLLVLPLAAGITFFAARLIL